MEEQVTIDFCFAITDQIKPMMRSQTILDTETAPLQEVLPTVLLAHYSLAFKPVIPFFSFVLLARYSLFFLPAGFAQVQNL